MIPPSRSGRTTTTRTAWPTASSENFCSSRARGLSSVQYHAPAGGRQKLSMSEQEQFAEPFKRIDAQQAKELIDRGEVSVIDVREDWEYANGHIPNAKHIPLAKIINAAQQHVQDDNVIFVCEVGQRSAVAAEFAAALGKQNLTTSKAARPPGASPATRSKSNPAEA